MILASRYTDSNTGLDMAGVVFLPPPLFHVRMSFECRLFDISDDRAKTDMSPQPVQEQNLQYDILNLSHTARFDIFPVELFG